MEMTRTVHTERPLGPRPLHHQPYRVREAHGVVRRVRCSPPIKPSSQSVDGVGMEGRARTRKKEHLALVNMNIPELLAVDDAQQHRALVLVKPLLHTTTAIHRRAK